MCPTPRFERKAVGIEIMPIHIPVQYSDRPQIVAVRVKGPSQQMREEVSPELKKVFTSSDIISRFARRVYFDSKIVAHETDWLYKPDIAVVGSDLMVSEYEIKVSIQDLRKELDYIEFVMRDHEKGIDPFYNTFTDYRESEEFRQEQMRLWRESMPKKYHRNDNKYRKHLHYLYGETPKYGGKARVNRFYFLIPKWLYEAEKERIDRIPMYGVVDADYFFSLKKCRQIHKGQLDIRTVFQIALNLSGRLRNVETK